MLPKSSVPCGAARAEQRVLLGGVLDVPAAEVRVVLLDARRDVVQRQAVLREQRRDRPRSGTAWSARPRC